MKDKNPIILCAGQNGRAVIFGYVDGEPIPGEPVKLWQARMLIYWSSSSNGLFGCAANGPGDGSRLTPAVLSTTETVWQEWIEVGPAAAEAFDAFE